MRFSEDLPTSMDAVLGHAQPANDDLSQTSHQSPEADRPSGNYPVDSKAFDKLHAEVFDAVKPETDTERKFLTRCLRALLNGKGQWSKEDTVAFMKVLENSRNGMKERFANMDFENVGFPDSQVA